MIPMTTIGKIFFSEPNILVSDPILDKNDQNVFLHSTKIGYWNSFIETEKRVVILQHEEAGYIKQNDLVSSSSALVESKQIGIFDPALYFPNNHHWYINLMAQIKNTPHGCGIVHGGFVTFCEPGNYKVLYSLDHDYFVTEIKMFLKNV